MNKDHGKGLDNEESCGETVRAFQKVTKSSNQSSTNPITLPIFKH